ncbi:Protein of unknown function, partial [Gryllus bimaculatus]
AETERSSLATTAPCGIPSAMECARVAMMAAVAVRGFSRGCRAIRCATRAGRVTRAGRALRRRADRAIRAIRAFRACLACRATEPEPEAAASLWWRPASPHPVSRRASPAAETAAAAAAAVSCSFPSPLTDGDSRLFRPTVAGSRV